jgi:hypothetical protein
VPSSIEVLILVTDGVVEVSLSPVALKSGAGQEILWRCYQGEARVVFKGDTPFAAAEFAAAKGGAVTSGVPRREAVRKDEYRYAVEVRLGERLCRAEGFAIYVDP